MRAESAVRTIAIAVLAEPFVEIKHQRHRKHVKLFCQSNKRFARFGLNIGGIDDRQFPGGESLAEVATRSLAFVADLPSQHEAIVVTHAGVMQTLLKSLRGLPLSGFAGQKIDYGQVFVLQREEKGWTLLEDAP